jgi:dienelactone hydrolase
VTRIFLLFTILIATANAAGQDERVVIQSNGWDLIGDLRIPTEDTSGAAVLMLNQAAGDRKPYEKLSSELAERGISSLRLDLRGHGESTNLDVFDPQAITEQDRETMIRSSDEDVIAAHRFLQSHPAINANEIAIVGASYSGEEMAEAGRNAGYAQAYVALSPGSFSDESIAEMDGSGASWLFIVTKNERYLSDIVAKVHEQTRSVEIVYLPGDKHATDILDDRADLATRIAIWLDSVLKH